MKILCVIYHKFIKLSLFEDKERSLLNHLLVLLVTHLKVTLTLLHILSVRAVGRVINSEEIKVPYLHSFVATFSWKNIL
jgi:hypothetical protein